MEEIRTVAQREVAKISLFSSSVILESIKTKIIPPPVPTKPFIAPPMKEREQKTAKNTSLFDNNFFNISVTLKIFYFCQKSIVFLNEFCYYIISLILSCAVSMKKTVAIFLF